MTPGADPNRTTTAQTGRVPAWLVNPRLWTVLLGAAVVALALAYLRYALLSAIDHDEVEHAHAAFRIVSGELPYRDFYQVHMPAYWALVSQWVKAFPFSINALLAGRGVNMIALAGSWFLGLRLLRTFPNGNSALSVLIYSIAVIILAFQVKFHIARPDPTMTFFGTAMFCLIPLRGEPGRIQALGLGLLAGLSIALSLKALPITLVFPLLMLVFCVRDRSLRPLTPLVAYGLGTVLAVLPTVMWLLHHNLFAAFYFDVIELNRSLSKPGLEVFRILKLNIYVPGVVGLIACLLAMRYRVQTDGNGPLIVLLAIICGAVLALLSRHGGLYNYQTQIIPVAIGFAALTAVLVRHIRHELVLGLMITAVVAYPTLSTTHDIVKLDSPRSSVAQRQVQLLMNLAKPGGRTCVGFSPTHPVFCHSISELSNGWDLKFPEKIKNQRQLQRFQRIWTDGIERAVELRPDIFVRTQPDDLWQTAAELELITQDHLLELDSMRSSYDVAHIGRRKIWVRR